MLLKGCFDATYFTYRLGAEVGPMWAAAGWVYVFLAVAIVQRFAPNYGKLFSRRQQLEGEYRGAVGHVINFSEAIAASRGAEREREIVESRLYVPRCAAIAH